MKLSNGIMLNPLCVVSLDTVGRQGKHEVALSDGNTIMVSADEVMHLVDFIGQIEKNLY